jgi:lysophospholipase L1-like esterase
VRYVAIGDSFTEGVGDEQPDGSVRGWADLVAAGLAAAPGDPVHYANLAIRGRLLDPIVTEQLEAALALDPAPTLITLNGGGNDMLRPGTDVSRLVALTDRAIRRCGEAGVRLAVLSGADPSDRLPFGRTIRRRGEELTQRIAALASANEVLFVDVFHDREIRHPAYWSADRLHLNADGHQRVAGLVLTALGADAATRPARAEPPEARRLLTEARFYWEYVVPWVRRRIGGQSSGDNRAAKYAEWTTIKAPTHDDHSRHP